jgi:hypothetical protein
MSGQSACVKLIGLTSLVLVLSLPAVASSAEPSQRSPQVGDTYEITRVQDSSSEGSDESSGTSHDQDAIIERIEAIRPDGLEVVFDLPKDATADERRQTWQFPARVFEPREGPLQLLNASELEKRVDAWLKWGKMTREACGHWIFTWNAFRIECDPQSVIGAINTFAPRLGDLHAGTLYRDQHALRPVPLTMKSSDSNGSTFTALLAIDPNAVRRERAEADVVAGEIMQKPVGLDAALVQRANEAVSGTILVTIDTDAGGSLRRLTKLTKSQTKKPDGTVQTETVTEILSRRRLSP